MSQSINFKGMLRKAAQEEVYPTPNPPSRYTRQKQNSETTAKENPYLYVTNRIQKNSQHYQKGDLKGLQSNLQPQTERLPLPNMNRRKARNSSYFDADCDEEVELMPSRNNGPSQVSLISSNNQQASLFESKLYQTKDQLREQITEIEKRIEGKMEMQHNFTEQYIDRKFKKLMEKIKECKNEYTGGFSQIVNQLNTNIESMRKKNKQSLTLSEENALKINQISDKINQYMNDVDEKLERLLNSDASSSVRKSLGQNPSMNFAGDYALDLKNSIKQLSCPISNDVVNPKIQELKSRLEEMEESMKTIKFEILQINTKIESVKYSSEQNKKKEEEKDGCSNLCLKFQEETLRTIKKDAAFYSEQLAKEASASTVKYHELRQILQIQEQNIKGINDEFTKVTNHEILPRIRKLQQTKTQVQASVHQCITELKSVKLSIPLPSNIKKQILQSIPPAKIMRAKGCDSSLKLKIEKSQEKEETMSTYLVDEENNLLDCYGNYLLNGNNCRLKLSEEEMYYLMSVEQVSINSIA